jgi:hypothetical protein
VRRRQLVEIEDLAWCPRAVRDGGTDWLGFMANMTGFFSPVAPKIRAAMVATRTTNVVDLCSGGGGPWLSLERALATTGPATVELSDLYPNLDAFGDLRARSGGRLGFQDRAVDATDVPQALDGVRTMFNSFHHFPPEIAGRILADAVRKRRAIAIVEGIRYRSLGLLAIPFQLPAMLLLTPFVRPFRWSRLFFTYLVPLIPLLVLFDGTVSMLRVYMADELRELVQTVPGHESFDWDIGAIARGGISTGPSYLIGVPKRP